MKNIEQFIALLIKNNYIDKNKFSEILDIFDKEFPNSDILKLIEAENNIRDIINENIDDTIINAIKDLFMKESSNIDVSIIEESIRVILKTNTERAAIDKIVDIYQNIDTPNKDIEVIRIKVENILKTKETVNDKLNLESIMTFSEATEKFHLGKSTLRQNLNYSRYREGEVRLSKGTWLIHENAIKRLYPSKYEMYKLEE